MPSTMKSEILQKTLQLFLKHGIREMNNEKLVDLLGISTKTIYKYFKNKEKLVEEVVILHHLQGFEMFKNRSVSSAACLFFDLWHSAVMAEYDVNNTFFRDLHYYYPELLKKIEKLTTRKFTEQFLNIINRAIEEGSFRNDILLEVFLENIYVQYEATARSDRFKRFRLSPDILLLNTISNSIRGICTLKGAVALDRHIQKIQLPAKA